MGEPRQRRQITPPRHQSCTRTCKAHVCLEWITFDCEGERTMKGLIDSINITRTELEHAQRLCNSSVRTGEPWNHVLTCFHSVE